MTDVGLVPMPRDRIADPLPRLEDVDYVRCFEALAAVELEIRRRGPSPHLLLRRAMLSMAIGNYVAALDAAKDAVAAAPRDPEAHYQEGLAWLWLARVQVGIATMAPGQPVPTRRPLRSSLESAYDAFSAATACAEDTDAEAAAGWLEHVLSLPDGELEGQLSGQV